MLGLTEDIVLDIEALIFASDNGITIQDICSAIEATLGYVTEENEIKKLLAQIMHKYNAENFAIALVQLNSGYQFLTKKKHHDIINHLQAQRSKKRLTQSVMETLAIIAYRQPVAKLEIEQIRGVNCDYTIQRLLEKDLISIAGKGDGIGHPLLYTTSTMFMDYFGINSNADLPHLKDIANQENSIGEEMPDFNP